MICRRRLRASSMVGPVARNIRIRALSRLSSGSFFSCEFVRVPRALSSMSSASRRSDCLPEAMNSVDRELLDSRLLSAPAPATAGRPRSPRRSGPESCRLWPGPPTVSGFCDSSVIAWPEVLQGLVVLLQSDVALPHAAGEAAALCCLFTMLVADLHRLVRVSLLKVEPNLRAGHEDRIRLLRPQIGQNRLGLGELLAEDQHPRIRQPEHRVVRVPLDELLQRVRGGVQVAAAEIVVHLQPLQIRIARAPAVPPCPGCPGPRRTRRPCAAR